MSVPSPTAWVQVTVSTLPQNVAIPFVFQAPSDLSVIDSKNSPPISLTLNSDYSVTGGAGSTGTLTLLAGGSNDVQVGQVITITRRVPITQTTLFPQGGPVTPAMISAAIDKLTEIAQQLNLVGSRSLQFQIDETLNGVLPLGDRKTAFLAFDEIGRVWFPTAASIVTSITSPLSVSSITALRLVPVTGFVTGIPILVLGYYVKADGGGGIYVWDAASTAQDNGGNIIQATGVVTGRWVLNVQGPISIRQFGAKGDGVTDDAVAIDKCVAAISALGGGTCFVPRGTFLLGTLSTDPNTHVAFITPKNNVSIVGEEMGSSVLKVADGMNASFAGVNAPNIIGTEQATPLTNCRFAEFTVDWNGANNLITGGMLARNNASIISLFGGTRILCERLFIKETPGNQCIFIPASSELGQGDIIVRDSVFLDSGSGLVGNTNGDHTSVYLNGDRIRVENCTMTASQRVNGTCFELHGSDAVGLNNYGNFYTLPCFFATDFKALQNGTVENCFFDNMKGAVSVSAPTYGYDNITIRGCVFRQYALETYTVGQTFLFGVVPGVVCNGLIVDGCSFIASSRANCRMVCLNFFRSAQFTNNNFSGFVDLGFWMGGSNLGNGNAIDYLAINGNFFSEVTQPVYYNVPGLAFGALMINGNNFIKSASSANYAIEITATGGTGRVTDNNISANYTLGTNGIFNNVTTLYVINYAQAVTALPFPTVFGLTSQGAATYVKRLGQATKIGNRVFFDIQVEYTGHTGTGGVALTLPAGALAPIGTATVPFPVVNVYAETITLDPAKQLSGLVVAAGAAGPASGPYITLLEFATGAPAQLQMEAAATLIIAGSYVCTP